MASAAATVATRVAGEAQSAVSGAITSVETSVRSIMPKNCSLGIKYYCISFTDRIECGSLPLNVSNALSNSVIAIKQLGSIKDLDQALAVVTPTSIKYLSSPKRLNFLGVLLNRIQ
jgi:hypothetical protein